jgi:hypothetical protein
LVSEIGWPMLLPYRKTTPSRCSEAPIVQQIPLQPSWLASVQRSGSGRSVDSFDGEWRDA